MMFPHYFEKHTTDGVDFSIYIGASLVENGKFDLVVKPLHGRNNRGGKGEGMKVYSYHMPKNTKGKWSISLISDFLHGSHTFHPINWDGGTEEEFLQAAFEGVWLFDRRAGKCEDSADAVAPACLPFRGA